MKSSSSDSLLDGLSSGVRDAMSSVSNIDPRDAMSSVSNIDPRDAMSSVSSIDPGLSAAATEASSSVREAMSSVSNIDPREALSSVSSIDPGLSAAATEASSSVREAMSSVSNIDPREALRSSVSSIDPGLSAAAETSADVLDAQMTGIIHDVRCLSDDMLSIITSSPSSPFSPPAAAPADGFPPPSATPTQPSSPLGSNDGHHPHPHPQIISPLQPSPEHGGAVAGAAAAEEGGGGDGNAEGWAPPPLSPHTTPQTPGMPVDVLPTRYLVGCGPDAARRWRVTHEWRAAKAIDTLLSRPSEHVGWFKSLWTHHFHRRAKHNFIDPGQPGKTVYYDRINPAAFTVMTKKVTDEELEDCKVNA